MRWKLKKVSCLIHSERRKDGNEMTNEAKVREKIAEMQKAREGKIEWTDERRYMLEEVSQTKVMLFMYNNYAGYYEAVVAFDK